MGTGFCSVGAEDTNRAPRRNFPNQPQILVVGFWHVPSRQNVIFCISRALVYVVHADSSRENRVFERFPGILKGFAGHYARPDSPCATFVRPQHFANFLVVQPGSSLGLGSGVKIFKIFEKIIDFQSALFGMKIGLEGLWMCSLTMRRRLRLE